MTNALTIPMLTLLCDLASVHVGRATAPRSTRKSTRDGLVRRGLAALDGDTLTITAAGIRRAEALGWIDRAPAAPAAVERELEILRSLEDGLASLEAPAAAPAPAPAAPVPAPATALPAAEGAPLTREAFEACLEAWRALCAAEEATIAHAEARGRIPARVRQAEADAIDAFEAFPKAVKRAVVDHDIDGKLPTFDEPTPPPAAPVALVEIREPVELPAPAPAAAPAPLPPAPPAPASAAAVMVTGEAIGRRYPARTTPAAYAVALANYAATAPARKPTLAETQIARVERLAGALPVPAFDFLISWLRANDQDVLHGVRLKSDAELLSFARALHRGCAARVQGPVADAMRAPRDTGRRRAVSVDKGAPGPGWSKVSRSSTTGKGATWEHVSGWRVSHCGHPTALHPYALTHPTIDEAVFAHNGSGFASAAVARAVVEALADGSLRTTSDGCAAGVRIVAYVTASGGDVAAYRC